MRLFTAVEVSAEANAELRQVQASLRGALSAGRWTAPENFHLTLHFLGEVADERLGALDETLASALVGERSFDLSLGPLGVFPRHGPVRVLWAGIEGDVSRLCPLEDRLRQGLLSLSLLRPDGRFSPHVTLVREPRAEASVRDIARGVAVRPVAWRVARLVLFRSVQTPTGSAYSVVNAYSLK